MIDVSIIPISAKHFIRHTAKRIGTLDFFARVADKMLSCQAYGPKSKIKGGTSEVQ